MRHETVGAHLVASVGRGHSDETVAGMLERLAADKPENVELILSIFFASSAAAAIGLGLPWVLARGGLDPAYGSGPVATVIQDILSILVYFAVLRAFGI